MELRHLRYFSAVTQYLNYSEASRRLHVAQAAISQTILDLEEELEARLLLRTKRSVQLTAAGSIFLKETEEILRRADQATRLVRRAARGEVGTLRIGFLGPATSEFLPALIQDYRSKYPDVELRLEHMTPDEQLAAFDEDKIDVGLSRSLPPERRPSFNESTIYTDYLIVALPGAHPLAKERAIKLKKLAGERFVLFNRLGAPSAFDQVIAICVGAGFSPHVVRAKLVGYGDNSRRERSGRFSGSWLRPQLMAEDRSVSPARDPFQTDPTLCSLASSDR